MRLQAWIDKCFGMEEMDGDGICPTYLRRWTLFKLKASARGVYLHHFLGDDWSRDLHDHPKRFISVGLWGRYIEQTPAGEKTYRAPWLRTFPATHIHRLRLVDRRPCWTLVVVLRTVRRWGFWSAGRWVPWREYVASDTAKHRKACI